MITRPVTGVHFRIKGTLTEIIDEEGDAFAVIKKLQDGKVELTIGVGASQVTTMSRSAAKELSMQLFNATREE